MRFLSRAPRPIASDSNASTRQYIVDRLKSLELEPQVHSASAQKTSVDYKGAHHVSLGVANNIVVRKAGSAPDHALRPALLIASHYDRAADRIGAADASAALAAMLETLRIASPDEVHFELPIVGQVQYTVDHVWTLTRLVCFMFFLACCLACKRMEMEPRMLVAGATSFLLLALALAVTAIILWNSFPGPHHGDHPISPGAGARDRWYFLA